MAANDPTRSVCVIGAGPAGLMAAIAAGMHASVIVLERGDAAGRKLLLTGGGRCNLTHDGSVEDFIKACKPYGNSLKPAFFTLSPHELTRFFQERNLETVTEPNGCVFPRSGTARDVRTILLHEAGEKGATFYFGHRVQRIEKQGHGFSVGTDKDLFSCASVIIATGGVSWPQTGSTGDGYSLAQQFGHTVITPIGILCPVVCKEKWCGLLQGTSLAEAAITVRMGSKSAVCRGAAVFTEDGVGGPAAFDVTRLSAASVRMGHAVAASFDFYPQLSRPQLESALIEMCSRHPKKEMLSILNAYVPKRICDLVLKAAGLPPDAAGGQLRKEERKRVLESLKDMPLTIVKHAAIEKATVTGGGVAAKEIDLKTMQSRLCPGLFLAGEVIDVDGPCGGYNLQIAFSTGALAGQSAAAYAGGKGSLSA